MYTYAFTFVLYVLGWLRRFLNLLEMDGLWSRRKLACVPYHSTSRFTVFKFTCTYHLSESLENLYNKNVSIHPLYSLPKFHNVTSHLTWWKNANTRLLMILVIKSTGIWKYLFFMGQQVSHRKYFLLFVDNWRWGQKIILITRLLLNVCLMTISVMKNTLRNISWNITCPSPSHFILSLFSFRGVFAVPRPQHSWYGCSVCLHEPLTTSQLVP